MLVLEQILHELDRKCADCETELSAARKCAAGHDGAAPNGDRRDGTIYVHCPLFVHLLMSMSVLSGSLSTSVVRSTRRTRSAHTR